MFDKKIRTYIDPILLKIGKILYKNNITATQVTLTGFMIGVTSLPLLSNENYIIALAIIIINRIFDGIDGAVAHYSAKKPSGGFLDIICDFIFYGIVILGFALADNNNLIYATILIFSFLCTASSFLATAIFLTHKQKEDKNTKLFYYHHGIIEGSETIVFFICFCIFPNYFPILAILMSVLCLITSLDRIYFTFNTLKNNEIENN